MHDRTSLYSVWKGAYSINYSDVIIKWRLNWLTANMRQKMFPIEWQSLIPYNILLY